MKTQLKFLCVIGLVVLAIVAHSNAQVDPEAIVGIWHCDDDDGDIAEDSSENGRDGTIENAELDDGVFGKCLNFEKGDTVVVPLGNGIIRDEVSIVGDVLNLLISSPDRSKWIAKSTIRRVFWI